MPLIYGIFVWLYGLAIRLAALWSDRARLWVDGREGLFLKMEQAIEKDTAQNGPRKTLWFHCASLGEFEQGRPVLERFRKEHPNWRIMLTFFSPSGYQVRKDYEGADHVFYLPHDTRGNVCRFLDLWQPNLVVFVKYEFWFNYIRALAGLEVPMVVVSAIFRPNQYFFRFYAAWFRRQLARIHKFYVQDAASARILQSHGIKQVEVSGDTRFDRVYKLAEVAGDNHIVEAFVSNARLVIVGGSTWPKDEGLLLALLEEVKEEGVKLILAPHEVHVARIEKLRILCRSARICYSSLENVEDLSTLSDARILIVDRIGLLSRIYRYGHLAFIGGGFGKGIHNTLEAATFGLPVLFGPNYQKFAEARDLIALGGAFCVQDAAGLTQLWRTLTGDPGNLKTPGTIGRSYVEKRKGATSKIMQGLEQLI